MGCLLMMTDIPQPSTPQGQVQPSPPTNNFREVQNLTVSPTAYLQTRFPTAIWLEDALSYHGVPILVFDLCLLVRDENVAA